MGWRGRLSPCLATSKWLKGPRFPTRSSGCTCQKDGRMCPLSEARRQRGGIGSIAWPGVFRNQAAGGTRPHGVAGRTVVATHHRDTQVVHKISPHPLSAVNLGPNQAFEVQEQGKEQSNSLTSACPVIRHMYTFVRQQSPARKLLPVAPRCCDNYIEIPATPRDRLKAVSQDIPVKGGRWGRFCQDCFVYFCECTKSVSWTKLEHQPAHGAGLWLHSQHCCLGATTACCWGLPCLTPLPSALISLQGLIPWPQCSVSKPLR